MKKLAIGILLCRKYRSDTFRFSRRDRRAIYDKIDFNDIETHKLHFSKNENIKKQLLEYCLKKSLAVSIELYNSNLVDVYGIIVEIQDEEIIVNKKNEADEYDGIACVLDKAISRISFK